MWYSWLPEMAAGLEKIIVGNGDDSVDGVVMTGKRGAGRLSSQSLMYFHSFNHRVRNLGSERLVTCKDVTSDRGARRLRTWAVRYTA